MYNEEEIRSIQKVMLEGLDYIDKICEENNIQYWLDSGTLLGAIRHKGFIPWDDDLDICMMRSDYDKFIEIVKKIKSKEFFLQTYETDKKTQSTFAKLRSRNNIMKINEKEEGHTGVFIDIFPVDYYNDKMGISKKKTKRKILFFWMKNAKYKFPIHKNIPGNIVKLISKSYFMINNRYDYKDLIEESLNEVKKQQSSNNGELMNYGIEVPFSQIYKRKEVFPLKKIIFEGKYYYAPNNYDAYLKELYGDYMQLPKEEDREPSHCYEIKLNISDEDYIKLNKFTRY